VQKSGISVQTLVISSAAAVAAAVIIPMFWARGTLIATAMTPIIVALVSEALRKPAEKITAVTPKVAARRSRPVTSEPEPEPFDPLVAAGSEDLPDAAPEDPFGLRAPARRRPQPHHWRLALATGLVAFAVAVVGLTASELVLGGPATRDSGRTTIFGGGDRNRADDAEETPEATATPEATQTPAATETPAPTPTPTATPTPTPVPVQPQTAPEATPTPTP
jgi:hypothetical protein